MEEIERLLMKAVAEIERILSSKTVVGEPITVREVTVIPLVSVGFGFGAGGGSGTAPAEGSGGGTGGGGGIKPVAVIIIDEQGTRVEPVKRSGAVMEKIADIVGRSMQKSKETKETTAERG